jgi:hypothetical protein
MHEPAHLLAAIARHPTSLLLRRLQVLLAMLRAARADYLCPDTPPTMREAARHLVTYMHTVPATGHEVEGGTGEPAEVMWHYSTALSEGPGLESTQQLHAVAGRLAAPDCKRRLQRQLELVAGSEGRQEPLLTVEQLQYCCCFLALDFAMLAKQPSAEQLAVLKAAAAISAQTMRQLEPNNPKSHFKAASALVYEATVRDFKQAVQGFLRAFELSRQQRSDYWSVQSAVNALSFATTRPSEVGHSALAATVAAFEQTAEAALRRCKRLLPEVWVRVLVVDVERARPLLPGAHEQLQLWQQQASSRPAADVVQAARHCRLVAVRRGQLPGSRRTRGVATLMRGTSQTATAAGSQQWACAAAGGARRRSTAGAAGGAASSAAACAAMLTQPTVIQAQLAGFLGLPNPILTQCGPTPCPAPAAAGSARWRTGLPTRASASPPDPRQAGAAAPSTCEPSRTHSRWLHWRGAGSTGSGGNGAGSTGTLPSAHLGLQLHASQLLCLCYLVPSL